MDQEYNTLRISSPESENQVELRGPVPLLGDSWGSHLFADAGRLWTRDERFTSSEDSLGVERLFWALGFGVDYLTPLGAIRVTAAYTMTPSFLDLADPGEMMAAIIDGTPLDRIPRHQGRRLQIHIGIGRRL